MNRDDFPILSRPHPSGKPLAYLDNAASSQRPTAVLDRLRRYDEEEHANVHRGMHHLAELATNAYEGARTTVAKFLNTPASHQLLFTRGTTEAINLVATGYERLKPGDMILITRMEHHSNIVPWQLCAQRTGATLRYLDVAADGTLGDIDAIDFSSVTLFAVTHVSNALGTLNPIAELAARAKAAGATVLVDGAQAVPHMPVDLTAFAEAGVDFYAFSGHKLCGPTGIGGLVGRTSLLETMNPFQGGGEMIDVVHDDYSTWADLPYKFEAGTPNMSGAVGLGAACDYLTGIGMERIESETKRLSALAAERLAGVDGLTLYGPSERGAAVSFNLDGIHPHDLAQILDQEGVAIRAGHLCCQPLMKVLDVPAVARASFYFYNTDAEIERLLTGIATAKRIFRI